MFELTILSIFRDSQAYLERYFAQVMRAFELSGGACHAVWLEGDSRDQTWSLLERYKKQIEATGHRVTLIKFDTAGPYWPSKAHPKRWAQLGSCWNRCMEGLLPSTITVCVESDLIWDPSLVGLLAGKLSPEHPVICPMLMLDQSAEVFGQTLFYDTWGFSRTHAHFIPVFPYWPRDEKLQETAELLEVMQGAGMIVSSYPYKKEARWDLSCCLLRFAPGVKTFMDKTVRISHPLPEKWRAAPLWKNKLWRLKHHAHRSWAQYRGF